MNTLQKVFWLIAVPASLVFLIMLIITIFVGDSDMDAGGDADGDVNADDGIGFQFMSVKNMVAFFTILGWSGIFCVKSGLQPGLSIGIAIGCGLLMMVIMASIYYFMGKLQDSGTLEMKNAISKTGEVYLIIPAKRNGMGKVQIKVQGALRTLDAMTDDEEGIKTGALIDVIDVKDNNILIVKKSSN